MILQDYLENKFTLSSKEKAEPVFTDKDIAFIQRCGGFRYFSLMYCSWVQPTLRLKERAYQL